MSSFVQPIIQGLQVLKEHKAAAQAQQQQAEQQKQKDLQQAIIQMVMQRIGEK